MNSGDISFQKGQLEPIKQLSLDVEQSEKVVRGRLQSFQGKVELWQAKKTGRIPDWARNHLLLTKQFELAVKELVASTETRISPEVLQNVETSQQLAEAFNQASKERIPEELLDSLKKCQETAAAIAKKVNQKHLLEIQRSATADRHYVDPSKLLAGGRRRRRGSKSSPGMAFESWTFNGCLQKD